MPVIYVKDGMGQEQRLTEVEPYPGIFEMSAYLTEPLRAFLPDGTVCSDGEYYGCQGYFHKSFGITTVDKEHEDLPFPFDICYLCGVDESPADKYIKALEGLKIKLPTSRVQAHNNALDEAIKTIREL